MKHHATILAPAATHAQTMPIQRVSTPDAAEFEAERPAGSSTVDFSFADISPFPPARHEDGAADGGDSESETDIEDESDTPQSKDTEAAATDDDEDDDGDEEPEDRSARPAAAEKAESAGAAPPPTIAPTSGQPLPDAVQQRMGAAFGADFGAVRIHEGSRAGAVGAIAYAQGNNLHFAPGRYNPTNAAGLHLLAHELTHVVQQRRSGAAAAQSGGILDDPLLEAEADAQATRVLRGEQATVQHSAVGQQRQADDGEPGVIQRTAITWPDANERVVRAPGSSTTTERPFRANFTAVEDTPTNSWKLDVTDITGGVDIELHTGGSRSPFDNPPTNNRSAAYAVAVMRAYYNRGTRGRWHTESASREHEHYHYQEWQCASEHYWVAAEAAIRALSVPKTRFPDAAAALAELRRTRGSRRGADDIVRRLRWAARRYWFTLPDNARSRPYAAGQLELNSAIRWVQILALLNNWNRVDQSDPPEPSTANPCFRPHLRYSP